MQVQTDRVCLTTAAVDRSANHKPETCALCSGLLIGWILSGSTSGVFEPADRLHSRADRSSCSALLTQFIYDVFMLQ